MDEVLRWSVQNTGKQKRKYVEVPWAVRRKLVPKALPTGFLKLRDRPPGYKSQVNQHLFTLERARATEIGAEVPDVSSKLYRSLRK